MTNRGIIDPLLLAVDNGGGPPWWLFLIIALVGVIVIGTGVYGIVTQRAMIGRRQKFLLSLFGVEEITGKLAVVIGVFQCLAGVLALVAAASGPFWAGSWAEDDHEQQAAAGAPRNPPPAQAGSVRRGPSAASGRGSSPANSASAEEGPAEPERLVAGREGAGEPFAESAPAGGLLVGLRLAKGRDFGGALCSVQPVYQVGEGYQLGQRHGAEGGDEDEIIARPGYAVAGIHARSGLVLNAIQVVFYRVDGTRLDPNDSYQTDWIGCDGGSPVELIARGDPIVGVFGGWEKNLVSLGLESADQLASPLPEPTQPPPDLWASPRPGHLLGREQGESFTDTAPEGGMLVGVRAFCENRSKPTLRAVQPIYLTGDTYSDGGRHGAAGDYEMLAVARPGFAVGGMEHAEFADQVGIRLVFVKVTPDGPDDTRSYLSPWLGHEFARVKSETKAGSKFAAGLTGFSQEVIQGLGLMLVGPRAVDLAAEPPEPPTDLRAAALARSLLWIGRASDRATSDSAPRGGLLVGLRCVQGDTFGGVLRAVQPVYRVGDNQVLGRRLGGPGGDDHDLIAKPGYGVGAVRAKTGMLVHSLQLVFYRIDGQRLDPTDQYESAWVGLDKGTPIEFDALGDPITGILVQPGNDLAGIGLRPVANFEPPATSAAAAAKPREDAAGPAGDFRMWTSADGKFRVEAKMLGSENGNVRLQRRDGRVITVPLARLSPADQDYARDNVK